MNKSLSRDVCRAIFLNDINRLRGIFEHYHLHSWDILDRRGLAPIHYAVYKGSGEMVSWLVSEGSSLNFGRDDNQYSPLHMAAMKGDTEICSLLLTLGAKRYVTNNIDRTAAQMAADNGYFHCATIINNFVPKEEVRYYIIPEYNGCEPKLPPKLEGLFYKFIMMTNIHPVKVVFELPPVFLVNDNALKIVEVLHLMSKRQFYKKQECTSTTEMLSFKFHYLAFILSELAKPNDDTSKNQTDPKDVFLQKISTMDNYLQKFLHECIVKFSYKKTQLYRQMTSLMVQGMDSMSSLDVILLLVGNKRAQSVESTDEPVTCAACDEINASKKCPKCKAVKYCDRECLKIHSLMHKKKCKQIRREIKDLKSSEETLFLTKCLSIIGIK